MISYDEAIKIAVDFSKEIAILFPQRIVAVFAIGSLGSDYYRPGQSDIDTAIIVTGDRKAVKKVGKHIEIIADRYWKQYNIPKGFGTIVFAQEQLYPPYVIEEELILEILRLKMQSKLLYGDYNTVNIPFPDKQAIIDDAIAFQEWANNQKKNDRSFGVHDVQTLVNSTLIALKRYLMIKHDVIEFNKFKVIDTYMRHKPPVINDELFYFINLALHNDDVDAIGGKLLEMIKIHDEIYATINNMVLYNDKNNHK